MNVSDQFNVSHLPAYLQETVVGVKTAYEKARAVSLHEGEDCLHPWEDIGRTLRDLWREKYLQVQSDYRSGSGSASGRPIDPVFVAFAQEARRPLEEARAKETEAVLNNPAVPVTRSAITEALRRVVMKVPLDNTFTDELAWAYSAVGALDPRVREILEDAAPSLLVYARREFLGQPDRRVGTDEKAPQ